MFTVVVYFCVGRVASVPQSFIIYANVQYKPSGNNGANFNISSVCMCKVQSYIVGVTVCICARASSHAGSHINFARTMRRKVVVDEGGIIVVGVRAGGEGE